MAIPQNETNDWLDVLFAKRNKAYGAYDLRKNYSLHYRMAALVVASGVLVWVLSFFVWIWVAPAPPVLEKRNVIANFTQLKEPPSIQPPKVQAVKPNEGGKAGGGSPAETVKPTVKFVPPVVRQDNLVQNEEPPPKVETLKKVEASNETQKGDSTAVVVAAGSGNGVGTGNGTGLGDGNGQGNGSGSGTGSGEPLAPEVRTPAKMVRVVAPVYTPEAKSKGIKARVNVAVQIDDTGKVAQAKILRMWLIDKKGNETPTESLGYGLEESAIVAANRYLFRPAKLNNKPIASNDVLELLFGVE